MKTRLLASVGGVVLAGALTSSTTSATWAAEPSAPDHGVHSVHCQSPQFETYVKFTTPGTITPGGGPVCYTGIGSAAIGLSDVTEFQPGAHSGSFGYRYQPDLPIIVRSFIPGQPEQFSPPAEILSLTITS